VTAPRAPRFADATSPLQPTDQFRDHRSVVEREFEFTPPRDLFGPVRFETFLPKRRVVYQGFGTMEAASPRDVFDPKWEPMPLSIWLTYVGMVISVPGGWRWDLMLHTRLREAMCEPGFKKNWICHPDTFDDYAFRSDFIGDDRERDDLRRANHTYSTSEKAKPHRYYDTASFAPRSYDCLVKVGCRKLSHVASLSEIELGKIPHLGRVSIEHIKQVLQRNGLRLREHGLRTDKTPGLDAVQRWSKAHPDPVGKE
jgi:hypothetical protein